jgi:hypothetical protein
MKGCWFRETFRGREGDAASSNKNKKHDINNLLFMMRDHSVHEKCAGLKRR